MAKALRKERSNAIVGAARLDVIVACDVRTCAKARALSSKARRSAEEMS